MFYELGLLLTIVVGLWMLLDVGTASGSRSQRLAIMMLGGAAALWTAGQLAFGRADAPEEVLLARRVLYAGACSLSIAWLWSAAQVGRARWLGRRPWLMALAAIPNLFAYSCLFWDTQGWFVSWTAASSERGPIFWAYTGYSWLLVAIGFVYFLAGAVRMGRAQPLRMVLITLGALVPLAGSIVYLLGSTPGRDPTPILLGFGGLMIRIAVIESGIAALLPIVRRDVLEQVQAGVLVANLDGIVVDANGAAAELLGQLELVGRPLDDLLRMASSLTDRSIEVDTFPVAGSFGEVGRGAVLLDRTAARRIERQLLHTRRLESIAILAGGIAHEVNNPLAFIRSNLARLEELTKQLEDPAVREALPAPLRELAGDSAEVAVETREGVDRIGSLVETLRRFARERAPKAQRRPVDLAHAVRQACRIASAGREPEAVVMRLRPVPPVLGDEDQLVQVLVGLLVNAFQASDAAGQPARIEVELRPVRGGVLGTVRDHGPGIQDEDLPHLFDPFFTTKSPDQGSGLGLSFAFDVARQHGGTLEAANRPDGGAAFHLWLPALEGEGEAGEESGTSRA